MLKAEQYIKIGVPPVGAELDLFGRPFIRTAEGQEIMLCRTDWVVTEPGDKPTYFVLKDRYFRLVYALLLGLKGVEVWAQP